MLILRRRVDEQVVIDGEVTVTVIEVRGDSVRLGFTAPPNVAINRREVHDAIEREREFRGPNRDTRP